MYAGMLITFALFDTLYFTACKCASVIKVIIMCFNRVLNDIVKEKLFYLKQCGVNRERKSKLT